MIKQTYLYIFILIGVWFTGCQDFDTPINNPLDIDGKTVEVSLATKVPAISIMTRGEASKEEKQLEHVDILVFKVEKNGSTTTEKFAYYTQNTNDLSGSEQNSEDLYIKAKLKLSEEEEEYRLVLVANLKEELAEFFKDDDYEDKTKEELIKEITFLQEKKWPTGNNGSESFRALPMWAESSKTTTVTKNTNADSFGDINFIRSVARIDLSVAISTSTPENGSDLFEIQEVTVYNARKIGRAIPDAENVTTGKATMPSLAAEDTIAKANMVYKESISDNKIANIYVNEARNQEDGKETSDALFLIIKAIYKGEDSNNTIPTYYKVGFYDDNSKPVDILRNFTYKMFITSVKGPGEDDEEDAIKSNSNNLTVALTEWSDFEMKYVVFSGKYYLAVSECNLTVPKPEDTHSFLVKTNYPDGWKAEITEGKSWMKDLTPTTSTKVAQSEPLAFKVEQNDEEDNREGEINITAGNLTLDVCVIQTTEIEYSLTILINDSENDGEFMEFDKTITFPSGYNHLKENLDLTPRTLKIIWTPDNIDLMVDFNPYFAWGEETEAYSIHSGGETTFKVVPTLLTERATEDWYPEAVGDIQVQIGEDSNTRQNVLIRRRHHEVYIEKADRYILDGDKHTFKLYSNTDWKAKINTEKTKASLVKAINILQDFGGYNLEEYQTGENILFETNGTLENISDDIVIDIEFRDADDKWFTKEYIFHVYCDNSNDGIRFGEEANCYVLQTGGNSVSIPVSQANRSPLNTNPISSTDQLSVEFIWTDSEHGYGSDQSPVRLAEMEVDNNTGPGARLIVESGNREGNAVIAVKNSKGICWSWHIWVVNQNENFDPYDESYENWPGFRYYEFLDRNLGALSATGGDPKSMGLYYQWGRKDPFPAADGIKSTDLSDMYNASGGKISWNPFNLTWNEMANEDNLMRTIENPNRLITTTASTNWYSANWSATATADFWNEMESGSLSTSVKGIFDPCPEGWKTVPGGAQLNTEWNNLFQVVTYNSTYNYSEVKGGDVDLGIWPHTGYINGSTGKITTIERGNYWTGTDNGFYEAYRSEFMGNLNAHPSTTWGKIHALPVRCMRRTE